jgi:hypothetical protein
MVGWGIFLIILGAGSLLLPQLGIQFRLMELVDDYQPFAGIVVAIIGAALVLLGMNRSAPAPVQVNQAPAEPVRPAAPPDSATPPAETEDPYRRP